MLEKALKNPLDGKEVKPINPKGNQPWIFIGRTDAEAPGLSKATWREEIGKDPDAGKNWRQSDKRVAKDEMVRQLNGQLSGHEFEQTPGDGEGQGSLACCSPWGRKELDST